MSRTATSVLVFLVVAVCVVCPMTQVFDHWDHEFQTGQDTESALVFVALCLGMTLSLVRAILAIYQGSPSGRTRASRSTLSSPVLILVGTDAAILNSASPPLTSLRI